MCAHLSLGPKSWLISGVSKYTIRRETDELKNSNNFGRDDLLRLARVAELADGWIYEQNEN